MKLTKDATPNKFDRFIGSKLFLIFYSLILIAVFFNVYNQSFDKKINLGGDNIGYYILGQSIAQGKGYTNIHRIEQSKHNHFPPGYPAIIGAFSKVFSNKILFIKKVNGMFFLLTIGALFFIVYKATDNYHTPFIVSLFTLLNFHLLSYSTIMMSEIPFIFFTTLGLGIIFKTDFNKPIIKNYLFIFLIFITAFSYQIRSTGIALFAAFTLFMIINKHWKYAITFITGFTTLTLPFYIRSQLLGGNAYSKALMKKNHYRPELGKMEFLDWFKRIWVNFERYLTREIPSGTINSINIAKYSDPITSSEWIVGVLIATLIIIGLIGLKKYRPIILGYLFFTFGILLLWPDVWTGVRFLIPLLPLLIFLIILSFQTILTLIMNKVLKIKNQSIVYIAIVILGLLYVGSYSDSSLGILTQLAKGKHQDKFRNYFEVATWAKENTPDSSLICCRKPQMFYIYSHRYVTGYTNTTDQEKLIANLTKKGTDYVVLEQLGYSSTGRYLYPAIQRHPEKFKIIKHIKEPDTYLMQFLPNLGYNGEWKDDKKNGNGEYVWANGNRFKGEWNNNKRNGIGTLYTKDGTYYKGTWTDDNLNGEVITYSSNGVIIDKSIFKNNRKIATSNGI